LNFFPLSFSALLRWSLEKKMGSRPLLSLVSWYRPTVLEKKIRIFVEAALAALLNGANGAIYSTPRSGSRAQGPRCGFSRAGASALSTCRGSGKYSRSVLGRWHTLLSLRDPHRRGARFRCSTAAVAISASCADRSKGPIRSATNGKRDWSGAEPLMLARTLPGDGGAGNRIAGRCAWPKISRCDRYSLME